MEQDQKVCNIRRAPESAPREGGEQRSGTANLERICSGNDLVFLLLRNGERDKTKEGLIMAIGAKGRGGTTWRVCCYVLARSRTDENRNRNGKTPAK